MAEATRLVETGDWTIRQLTFGDVPVILDIIRAVRCEYGIECRVAAILDGNDLGLLDHYRRRRAAYFVALEGHVVVRGAGIAPLAGGDAGTCELQRMYLRRESRGLGIGRRLLEACLMAAVRRGFVRCYAETVAQMEGAIAFYGRNGFRALDRPIGSTGHSHNDRWMLLELPRSGEAI
jgi:putative acetyltransferase